MAILHYLCNDCGGREFVIVDEPETPDEEALVPRMYPPYCPYCGSKDGVVYLEEIG